MSAYLWIIAAAVCSIAGTVAALADVAFFPVLAATSFATLVVMFVDGLTATFCRLLPAKFANYEKKIFHVSAKEKRFYEKLKIRKWKESVPEIGQFTGFRKNKIVDPKNTAYLERFLLESCYGQIGHFVSCLTGFLILLLFPVYELWFAVAIPVAVVSLLLNLPSLIILRYNSYKLRTLYDSVKKKEARKAALLERAVGKDGEKEGK